MVDISQVKFEVYFEHNRQTNYDLHMHKVENICQFQSNVALSYMELVSIVQTMRPRSHVWGYFDNVSFLSVLG